MIDATILPYSEAVSPQTLLSRSRPPRADAFFMWRPWIQAYLAQWHPEEAYGVVRVTGHFDKEGAPSSDPSCAYAWLGQAKRKTSLGLPVRSLGFNLNFRSELSSITLEENGLFETDANRIPSRDSREAPADALFFALIECLERSNDWDEIQFNALNPVQAQALEAIGRQRNLIVMTYADDKTFWVDLDHIRERFDGDFLKSCSANTRQQLRRARRQVEKELGSLQLETASTCEQALEWLDCLARLHQLRWPSQDPHEGFNSQEFCKFNEVLTRSLFEDGALKLHRISAGHVVLGYLYNIELNGRTHFMMSGISYEGKDQYRPGMLCHWLAIDNDINKGLTTYDFLKGSSRYKESLATHQQQVRSLIVRRRRPVLVLEDAIRRMRDRLRSRTASTQSAA